MTITIKQLVSYLNSLLQPEQWRDYCPNGLQIEGCRSIHKIVTGVSACQELLNQAIIAEADAILVHHGYFWKGEDPCILGIKRKRILTLLNHNLHLLAYHLPLDGHSSLGNNVQLAKQLGIEIVEEFICPQGPGLGLVGELPEAMSGNEFKEHVEHCLQRQPLYIHGQADNAIKRIAWCTGAAQDFIEQAIVCGVDAYLTGEISERTVHIARESGIHFYAAGHHATERYGIKALGEHLSQHFKIDHQFIDIDNPV